MEHPKILDAYEKWFSYKHSSKFEILGRKKKLKILLSQFQKCLNLNY